MIEARAAIVHDWFQGYHGAERVVDVIRGDVFAPDRQPDVLTFYAARELLPPALAGAVVRESWLANLPGLRQRGPSPGRWRYLLPYMPLYFRRLKLEGYELVISSSHTFALGVRAPAGILHVCYCHTPSHYAWPIAGDEDDQRVARSLLRRSRGLLRRIDRRAAKGPDSYVANSEAVRQRIRRYYGRDATVIHPPVDVSALAPATEKERGHFLWVQRLVPHKRPELVAEAFRGLPYRLTMVGVGRLGERLRANLPANVELLGWLPRAELSTLYGRAAGFIHAGEEDFGISMVEALAAGTPVLALGRGGAVDIVRPDVDGILIDDPELDALRAAIVTAAERDWDTDTLVARAREFSTQRFVERFEAHLRALGVR